jgi:hypothetical protein
MKTVIKLEMKRLSRMSYTRSICCYFLNTFLIPALVLRTLILRSASNRENLGIIDSDSKSFTIKGIYIDCCERKVDIMMAWKIVPIPGYFGAGIERIVAS